MPGRDVPWAIIAGGGTAGHVLPAIAVADALVANGHPPTSLTFVGSSRGIEARLVPEAGYRLVLLPGRGIQRRLTLANVRSAAALGWSVSRMVGAFAMKRPAVVLSVGGYASVPCAVAATLWRVPLVLAEANARAGAANRMVARRARACAVAFSTTGLPRAQNTGNPVRAEIAALANLVERQRVRNTTRQARNIPPSAKVVVVFGGSLGARAINDAAIGAAELWAHRNDLVLYLITGERDAARGVEARAAWLKCFPAAQLDWRVVAYERSMPGILAAADVVVSRAGATSIADAAVVGLPCILVPLPSAAEDHQSANAEAVAADGAGVVVRDTDLNPARLVAEVDAILADTTRAHTMSAAAIARGRPDAASAVALMVERYARNTKPPRSNRRARSQHRLG